MKLAPEAVKLEMAEPSSRKMVQFKNGRQVCVRFEFNTNEKNKLLEFAILD